MVEHSNVGVREMVEHSNVGVGEMVNILATLESEAWWIAVSLPSPINLPFPSVIQYSCP
jgi:hypothetical protein